MFRNHYTTIAAWIIVYISLWLSRDNLVSSKFSKNNCHTGFVSRIIETMIFPFQWYKNRPTYEYVVGLVLLCCISVVAVIKCFGCSSPAPLTLKICFFMFVILAQYFNADGFIFYIKNIDYLSVILDNISIHFESGHIYGIIGKNGSGKTMLLRAISGLIVPSSGVVYVDGKALGTEISFPPEIGI